MKKLLLILLLAGATAYASQAQIIQGKAMTMTVEKAAVRSLDPGYRGFAEPGIVLDLKGIDVRLDLDITTTHGWQFRSGIFLGGGTGIGSGISREAFAIPLYANFRYYLPSRSSLRFYADARLGCNISVNEYTWMEYIHYKFSGLYASVGIGMEIGRFSLSASYMPRRYKSYYEDTYYYFDPETNRDYNWTVRHDIKNWDSSLVFRIGYRF